MNHTQKISLGRRMRTRQEREDATPIFLSIGWKTRKNAIKLKEIRKENLAYQRKEAMIKARSLEDKPHNVLTKSMRKFQNMINQRREKKLARQQAYLRRNGMNTI